MIPLTDELIQEHKDQIANKIIDLLQDTTIEWVGGWTPAVAYMKLEYKKIGLYKCTYSKEIRISLDGDQSYIDVEKYPKVFEEFTKIWKRYDEDERRITDYKQKQTLSTNLINILSKLKSFK